MSGAQAMKTIHRYEVPVDDLPYTVTLAGDPFHVAAFRSGRAHGVEFWAEHHPDGTPAHRVFQAYGTGHPIPPSAKWWGTAARVDGLVWHLYELGGSANV